LEVGQIVCLEVAEALLQTRAVWQPGLILWREVSKSLVFQFELDIGNCLVNF
jgi:hypothetical protein